MGQLAVPEEAASSLSTLASQRVAVCMVGAVRTLLLGAVHHSVKKNLLHAQLVPADLFLHLHLGWDYTAHAGNHGARGEQVSRSDERLRKAIEHLNPVNVSLVEQSDCSSAEMRSLKVCAEIAARKRSDKGGALAGYLQYMWIARSLQTVMAYERAHGLTYAWVIRTRPDLAFFDRVPPAVTMSPRRMVLMEKESSPAYFDAFFMIPRPLLDDFVDGLLAFWDSETTLPWPPEFRFFPWMRSRRRFPWGYALIPAALVRSAGGNTGSPDCWRLSLKETPQFIYELQGTAWGRGSTGELLPFRRACEVFFASLWGSVVSHPTAPAPVPRRPYSGHNPTILEEFAVGELASVGLGLSSP
ncbi:hypothetical protein EMIHUDRAFT_199443 [Emiliania huxleyi CCMP1516]|uniref:Uncharacterized protein n=2 Tax=Emiliania huxleyi TaxID=2903 RepID=A0A0D3KZL9_EMIH1|nr:hypothetical protein EMIHUDRAFT_199443 [Emiliania huxleyi CCMP1516]EOD41204.1 hypothetical protein EMIHUDRAFT_199443 [Emiliania huxleyi CCMP1516]|eukprot:XP_005793633.1 hypothetical protein EMIHUDRAFT_199443 [Emiliania huxleyi CCMP1516]